MSGNFEGVIIPDSDFGRRVRRHLAEDPVAWLTTVTPAGTPQPSPIWFLWDEAAGDVLIYSKSGTARTRNLEANSRASLNFDGNGQGGDIVVLEGKAIITNDPPSTEVDDYQNKYLVRITDSLGMTAAEFAERYPVPIRFFPERLRGH